MSSPEAFPPDMVGISRETLEDLQRRNAELGEAVAARDAFIAVAAHELRNPMTPMIGQVELLLTGMRNGRYSPEQIEQRLQRLQRIMGHYIKRAGALLDVSRITTGKLTLELTSCDFPVLARDVMEMFAEAARYAGCSIGIDAPESLLGIWDRMALEQIIDNLVSNAMKYAPGRPVQVCVEDLGDRARLRVRDHGPGISLENRSRIFGRFERAVGLNEQRSGFGVGLWVVRQLVEAMQGTIEVDDAQGGGSVFSVTLPRYLETNSDE